MTNATAAAIAGELALLDPAVRADRISASRLIDPGFIEVGQGGRLWDHSAILTEFGSGTSVPHVTISEMDAVLIDENVVLVTYVSTIENRSVRRSSIWRESGEGWRVMFHQGTRID